MVRALLTFAADEPSKVPFYIAGSAFAAWAVLLSFLGLSRASFPGGQRGQGVVIGISVLLAAAALGTAIGTASTEKPEAEAKAPKRPAAPAPPQTAGGTQAPLQLAADPSGQLRYDKKALKGSAGKITIDFTNDSDVGHDVTIARGPTKLGGTKVITKSKASVTVDLKPGKYAFYCSVPGHRQGGMQGTLAIA